MATTNIDDFFNKIKDDFVELQKEAARETAKRAQKDIRQKADQFISEYYEYKPLWYHKRKMALFNLVEDYYQESGNADRTVIEFGVEYLPSKIEGVHESNSWWHRSGSKWVSKFDSPDSFHFDKGDNGIPEAEWITEKFMKGEHPWAKTDDKSPDEKMQEFFDEELNTKIDSYMSQAMLNAIRKYL